jgi:hypothetical protein
MTLKNKIWVRSIISTAIGNYHDKEAYPNQVYDISNALNKMVCYEIRLKILNLLQIFGIVFKFLRCLFLIKYDFLQAKLLLISKTLIKKVLQIW